MAGHAVLEELGAAEQLHVPQQLVLLHTLVLFSIHCDTLGQKVDATMAHSASEAATDHGTVGVLDCLDGAAIFEAAAALSPCTLLLHP